MRQVQAQAQLKHSVSPKTRLFILQKIVEVYKADAMNDGTYDEEMDALHIGSEHDEDSAKYTMC